MIIGIDLGTTNSLSAVLERGIPTIIPNALGEALTPSVVAVDQAGVLMVGESARQCAYAGGGGAVASFKRLMGSAQTVTLGTTVFKPEELSALVLRSLKADAEALLGVSIKEAIVSVPAYFNNQQRKATRLAGQLAGLNVRRLINEPTAAALAHGIHQLAEDSKFLVFDLGGGTFDVSILERFAGIMEVRATGGDTFLGGDDFSEVMLRLVTERARLRPEQLKDALVAAALRVGAEQAKRALSSSASATVDIRGNAVTVSLEAYEKACEPLLGRLRAPVERALRDARLRARDLDEIVLVGGATRMPMVRRLVTQLFGRLPARHPDPDTTIALGTAVCAGLVARDAAFEEVVLTDVSPHTLGTDVASEDSRGNVLTGIFLPIIERNTVIPASRVHRLTTLRDNQETVRCNIYQGEAREVKGNVLLDGLTFDVPRKLRGEVELDLRLTYDVNGILEVDVEVLDTGQRHNLVITKLAGDVSDEEIDQRRVALAALKIHPREQEENRVLLEQANRMYQQLLGGEREVLGRWIDEFNAILKQQDLRHIALAREKFSRGLDSLDSRSVF